MDPLYNIGISAYKLAVRLASVKNRKARLLLEGQSRTFSYLREHLHPAGGYIWIHASSLGEFEQGRPLIEMIRRDHPNARILLSFFSPSGYEVRKNYNQVDAVCYLPFDLPGNVKTFLDLVKPSMAIFVKYEFWGNYLHELDRRGIPTYSISAIFRPSQVFFKPWGSKMRKILSHFDRLFVQNEESRQLLQGIGIHQVEVSGDTRFDRVAHVREQTKQFPTIERFVSTARLTVVMGSSWEPDEDNLKHYFDHAGEKLTLVIAPHVISDSHLEHIESLFAEYGCTRYSKIGEADSDSRILVIDNIGMLSSLYQYADVAYIGGGFGKGIHNILEAVTFGKLVVFGPNYHKFKEARDVIASGGGFSYVSYVQLQHHLDTLFNDPVAYDTSSKVCRQYLDDNLGSTQLILAQVNEDLKKYVSA